MRLEPLLLHIQILYIFGWLKQTSQAFEFRFPQKEGTRLLPSLPGLISFDVAIECFDVDIGMLTKKC